MQHSSSASAPIPCTPSALVRRQGARMYAANGACCGACTEPLLQPCLSGTDFYLTSPQLPGTPRCSCALDVCRRAWGAPGRHSGGRVVPARGAACAAHRNQGVPAGGRAPAPPAQRRSPGSTGGCGAGSAGLARHGGPRQRRGRACCAAGHAAAAPRRPELVPGGRRHAARAGRELPPRGSASAGQPCHGRRHRQVRCGRIGGLCLRSRHYWCARYEEECAVAGGAPGQPRRWHAWDTWIDGWDAQPCQWAAPAAEGAAPAHVFPPNAFQ